MLSMKTFKFFPSVSILKLYSQFHKEFVTYNQLNVKASALETQKKTGFNTHTHTYYIEI